MPSNPPPAAETSVVQHDGQGRESWILRPPLYSMKPSFLNLFMKKFTRERVVPIISASVSCETSGQQAFGAFAPAVAGQEEQRAGQPLFAGVEQVVHQVGFHADVPL